MSVRPSAQMSLGAGQEIACEGWLLKKRRKKMQGFARRYFVLHQSGVLSYSIHPKQPPRDQIALPHAAVSTVIGSRDIHIDSNNATFHIKCFSLEDFDTWMSAFRKYVADGGRKSLGRTTPRLTQSQWNRTSSLVDDMGLTIADMETSMAALLHFDETQKKHHSGLKSKLDGARHKEHLKEGGSVFGLFKKNGSARQDSSSQTSSNESASLSLQQRIFMALQALKSQHEALIKSLQSHADLTASATRGSSLPATAEENEGDPDLQSNAHIHSRKTSRAASVDVSVSDGAPDEWYDAPDGAGEEFILEESTPEEEKGDPVLTSDSRTSLGEFEAGGEDLQERHPDTQEQDVDLSAKALQVQRRSKLPSGPVGDEGSLFSMLKKNVGKDLTSIAFPVSYNEPLTLLQRVAEEVQYFDLLQRATEAEDGVERMCYVAAFAVSGYAHTRHRSSRKAFNPMLSETFEEVRMKYIAEKVQHKPVVVAYHAEGERWELHATSAGKTKFWGKSLEIIPIGTTHLKIGQDHYEWNKPSSFMRNLMMGTKYLEHCGKMTIENTTDKTTCVLEFKHSGYWGASNEVTGTIQSSSGEVRAQIEGKWDEQIVRVLDSSNLRLLWRITPFPKDCTEYYGFTSFGITLNEITSDLEGKLPPTDSRYRPDVRALEVGDIDTAESEKARVEEMQRERRNRGADRTPRWFKQVGNEWLYVGGYWEARARGWKDVTVEPLW